MYFDDLMQIDPSFARGSGSRSVGVLVSLFGIGWEDEKHVPNNQQIVGLGVLNDFSLAPLTHCVTLTVTESRKESVRELIDSVIELGWIQHAEAVRLYGKCRYTLCPIFGRIGVAALQPLNQVLGRTRIVRHAPLYNSLILIRAVTDALQPVVVRLFTRSDPPVIVLTDASQSGIPVRSSFSARVGVVLKDMRDGRMYYTTAQAPRWLILLLLFIQYKKTYICQFELVGVACAYLTFPDVLRGRLVHHFIDNEAALANCVNGYSCKTDSALVVFEIHIAIATIQCHPWFGFVYSEDNLSDLPSRNRFALLHRLGAIRRACILPTLKSW